MTMPPPTPSRPDRTPPARPMAISLGSRPRRPLVLIRAGASMARTIAALYPVDKKQYPKYAPGFPPLHCQGDSRMKGLNRFALLVVGIAGLVALAAAVAGARSTHSSADIKDGGTLTIGLAEEPDALDPTL